MLAALTAVLLQVDADPTALEDVVADDTTGWEWAGAALVLVGSVVVGWALRTAILRWSGRDGEPAGAALLVARMAQWLLVAAGLVIALGVLDARVTPLLGALGLGGLALALALQPTLENVFSGLVLHAQRPLLVGEEVATGDVEGRVLDITGRSVVLQSYDGERIWVPNKAVLDREIVNHVRKGRRRTTVEVGVAYGTDLRRTEAALVAAAAATEGVLDVPAPHAYARRFGESSIDFEVDVWHAPQEMVRRQVRAALVIAIADALADADITIPFPQRTLWWGAAPEDAGP